MNIKIFEDDEHTLFITRIISAGLMSLGIVMTVLCFLEHNIVFTVISSTYGLMSFISYLAIKNFHNLTVFLISGVILIYGLLISFILTGGTEGFGILWVVLYPLLFLYLLAFIPYTFICLSCTFIIMITMWTPLRNHIYNFKPSFMTRFPLLILCEVIFAIAIKNIIAKTERKRKEAIKELINLKEGLEKTVRQRTAEVQEEQKKSSNLMIELATSLAATIDAKDKYTSGHSKRVAEYSKMIAEKMGKNKSYLENIYLAALLHDIGKIGIPDEIINKKSKLTKEEYEIIKQHPVIGYEILQNIKTVPEIVIGVRWHHERYDGKGYPDGLYGRDIPEYAQIISVADAYDAMTSNRSYRPLMTQDAARSQIEEGIGSQFSKIPAECMLSIIDADKDFKLHE
ncbi:MAG: HD-GYP domain-containing protein [Treponema sp.]|nr:HD-GYP domain-containing protein [Treponema sp.]